MPPLSQERRGEVVTALEKLAAKIHSAHDVLPAVFDGEWVALADAALAENRHQWEKESVFRRRTGATLDWCQRNFDAYARIEKARRSESGKRREWREDARPAKIAEGDLEAIEAEIVDDLKGAM